MLRLRMLGGITVERNGIGLPEIAEQHKALALLALVAMSGERGLSRDRLAAYLWPERDAERARGALSQTVYTLRKQLGESGLFDGTRALRLDAAVIECDVWEFRRALDRGDYETVVALHTGPFLHGFFPPGSAELAHWTDEQRADLERRAGEALESLASRASGQGDHGAAVTWWRRRASLEPGNSRVIAALMTALAQAGDRAGALQAAQSHEAFLQQEFEAPPDPGISALASRIRQPNASPTSAASVDLHARLEGDHAARLSRAVVDPPTGAAPRRRLGPVVALGGMVVVAATAAVSVASRLSWLNPRPEMSERRIAVTGFANETGDSALASIGRIATDWVIQGLVQTQLVEVIGPGVSAADLPALGNAAPLSAGLIVRGSYSLVGDSLAIQAQVIEAATGRVVRGVGPISGSLHEPLAVIERLRQQLAGGLATRIDARLSRWSDAASQPTSFKAYRAFDEGLSAFFSLDPSANARAGQLLVHAGALDSTYSLPLLWSLYAFGNAGDSVHFDSVRRVLDGRRERLPRFDLALLDAHVAQASGDALGEYNALTRVVAIAPNSEWLYKLSRAAANLHRFSEADSLLGALDPNAGWMRDWDAYWTLLGDTRYHTGRHDAELVAISRRKVRFPDVRLYDDRREGRALAALGRSSEVLPIVDDALKRSPPGLDLEGLLRIVSAARVHGHLQLARAVAERAIRVSRTNRIDSTLTPERYRVLITEAAEMWEDAARSAQDLIRLDSIAGHHDALPYMVLLQAASHQVAGIDTVGLEARAVTETGGATSDGRSSFDSSQSPLVVQAELAALHRDVRRTATLLREAIDRGAWEYYGFSERPAFDLVRRDSALAQLLHNPAADRP